MKSFLFSYHFLFVTLITIPLSMCSKDNEETEQQPEFKAITLDLSGINLQQEDTAFTVNGFSFINSNAESGEYDTTSTLNDEEIVFNAISIWNNGTKFNYIELKLDDIVGLNKITSRVFNNGTQGAVILYNNNSVVKEIETGYFVSDIEMNVQNLVFDKLRITSYEGQIISIKLE